MAVVNLSSGFKGWLQRVQIESAAAPHPAKAGSGGLGSGVNGFLGLTSERPAPIWT